LVVFGRLVVVTLVGLRGFFVGVNGLPLAGLLKDDIVKQALHVF
jgi:hypothetical protein